MAERVKVTEAARDTGVPGTAVFLAIRHGDISTERDERGDDWVDPEGAGGAAVARSDDTLGLEVSAVSDRGSA